MNKTLGTRKARAAFWAAEAELRLKDVRVKLATTRAAYERVHRGTR